MVLYLIAELNIFTFTSISLNLPVIHELIYPVELFCICWFKNNFTYSILRYIYMPKFMFLCISKKFYFARFIFHSFQICKSRKEKSTAAWKHDVIKKILRHWIIKSRYNSFMCSFLFLWSCLFCRICCSYFANSTIFDKKCTWRNFFFFFFVANFVRNFCQPKRKSARCYHRFAPVFIQSSF